MADAETQYEDKRKFREIGTVPKVSMFKRRSAEEKTKVRDEKVGDLEEPDLSALFEEGGEFFLSDIGVQHDKEMEDVKDIGSQYFLPMIDSSTQYEIETTDRAVGEEKTFIETEMQSISSMFNLVCLFN